MLLKSNYVAGHLTVSTVQVVAADRRHDQKWKKNLNKVHETIFTISEWVKVVKIHFYES